MHFVPLISILSKENLRPTPQSWKLKIRQESVKANKLPRNTSFNYGKQAKVSSELHEEDPS